MKTITQHAQPGTNKWIECAPELAEGFHQHGDDIRELVAKDEVDAKVKALNDLVVKAQVIITGYLVPDGTKVFDAMNELVGLFDGPEQRAAQA